MKRIFVSTFILVIFMFPFSIVAKAETTSTIADYKEFDSFQKRYNEHLGELLYFMGTSYDSNDHYFKERMNDYRQALNETYDSSLLNAAFNAYENIMHKPTVLLSVVSDLKNALIGKIKDYFSQDGDYDSGLWLSGNSSERYVLPPEGFIFKGSDGNLYNHIYFRTTYASDNYFLTWQLSGSVRKQNTTNSVVFNTFELANAFFTTSTIPEVMNYYYQYPEAIPLVLVSVDSTIEKPLRQVIVPPQISNVYNRTINNFNEGEKFTSDYVPTVTPQLICNDDSYDLQYTDGSFYTKARQALVINPDETVDFNGVICNLDFKFPVLELDDLTGEVTADGESLLRVPSSTVPVENIDYSLVDYVRNSYNYATTVINSGVNGLKSIVAGTAGLIGFTGSMFGFLPPEILTLFIGGFSIALGLWVFKK